MQKKPSLSLADIMKSFVNGAYRSETLTALGLLTARIEVVEKYLELMNLASAEEHAVIGSLLALWLPEEEKVENTAQAAPDTITVARADLSAILYLARMCVRTQPGMASRGDNEALNRLMMQMYPAPEASQAATPTASKAEETTGEAAGEGATRTLDDIFGNSAFASVVVSFRQFPTVLSWLQDRGWWFAVETEPFRAYRVIVRIEHKEALNDFISRVVAYFS